MKREEWCKKKWSKSLAEPSLRKRSDTYLPKYLRIPNALRLNGQNPQGAERVLCSACSTRVCYGTLLRATVHIALAEAGNRTSDEWGGVEGLVPLCQNIKYLTHAKSGTYCAPTASAPCT